MIKQCVICGGDFEAVGRGFRQANTCSTKCKNERVRFISLARYERSREKRCAKQRERNMRNREKIRESQRRAYAEMVAALKIVGDIQAKGVEALQ